MHHSPRCSLVSELLHTLTTFVTDGFVMGIDRLAWSNPVAIWWTFLIAVSSFNIALLALLHSRCRARSERTDTALLGIEPLVLLSAAYVVGCAFRSVLPRADVQRICLFDTWLSSVVVGRSVATIAEVCFAAQWAIVLRQLAHRTAPGTARTVSIMILPLILFAECCSWYAVITTDYLGNAIENSTWALTFALIAGALLQLFCEFRGPMRLIIGCVISGIAAYVGFMLAVDIPMYLGRWQEDMITGKELLGVSAGFRDVSTRWAVTRDIAQWRQEIAWMSLYFSVAVWSSLALGSFGLVRNRLRRYRTRTF